MLRRGDDMIAAEGLLNRKLKTYLVVTYLLLHGQALLCKKQVISASEVHIMNEEGNDLYDMIFNVI